MKYEVVLQKDKNYFTIFDNEGNQYCDVDGEPITWSREDEDFQVAKDTCLRLNQEAPMTNDEILQMLLEYKHLPAQTIIPFLYKWNKDEYDFPAADMIKYIPMQTWKYEDFSFDMEKALEFALPQWAIYVFFDIKEFRSNPRNELTSTCEVMAKLHNYPTETQDDKAFCQHDYSLRKYFGFKKED